MKTHVYEINRGCTYCGGCIHECPKGAIKLTPNGAVISQEKCTGCGICAENCASEAITKVPVSKINDNS